MTTLTTWKTGKEVRFSGATYMSAASHDRGRLLLQAPRLVIFGILPCSGGIRYIGLCVLSRLALLYLSPLFAACQHWDSLAMALYLYACSAEDDYGH